MNTTIAKLAIYLIVIVCAAWMIFEVCVVSDYLIGFMILDLIALLLQLAMVNHDNFKPVLFFLIAKFAIRLAIDRFLCEDIHISLVIYDVDWLGKCLRDMPENREYAIVKAEIAQCNRHKTRLLGMLEVLEDQMEHGKINEGEYVSMAKEIAHLYAHAEVMHDYTHIKFAIKYNLISVEEANITLTNLMTRLNSLE